MADQNFIYGEQQQLRKVIESSASTTFKKKGYTFVNWTYTNKEAKYYNNLSKEEVKNTYVNEATISRIRESSASTAILTPNWKEHVYTVKFDPGTTSDTQQVSGTMTDMTFKYTDSKALIANKYAIVGYDFKGWVDKNDSSRKFTDRQIVSALSGERYGEAGDNQVVTLKAVWEPKTYDILFVRNDRNSGAGSTIASISVAGVDRGQERITIKATYGELYPRALFDGSADRVMAVRDGYDFLGWSLEQTIPYEERASKLIPTDARFESTNILTVYAQYMPKKVTAKLYALTRDGVSATWVDGPRAGQPVTAESIDHAVYFDMPFGQTSVAGLDPTTALETANATGFDLVRWFAAKNPNEANPIAEWSTYAKESSVDTNKFLPITDGTTLLNDYSMVKKDASGNLSMTLYAFWQTGVVRLYFVSTYSNVITRHGNREVSYMQPIGPLPTPTRKGYDLEKWMSYAHIGDPYPADPTRDVEITSSTQYWQTVHSATAYAAWKPKQYRVTFNIEEDKTGDSGEITWDNSRPHPASAGTKKYGVQYLYDSVVSSTSIPLPQKPGYKFLYWKTADASPKQYSADGNWTMDIDNDTTELYAYWEGASYTVTWDLWGGYKGHGSTTPSIATTITNSDGITYNQGQQYDIVTSSVTYKKQFNTAFNTRNVPNVTRPGYKLAGWFGQNGAFWNDPSTGAWTPTGNHGYLYKVEAGTVFVADDTGVGPQDVNNVRLYALWVPTEATLVFNYDDRNNTFVGNAHPTSARINQKLVFDDQLAVAREVGAIADGVPAIVPSVAVSGNIYSANANEPANQHAYPESQASSLRQSTFTLKEGYTFKGYNTKADGSGVTVTYDTVFNFLDGNNPTVNLYPQFDANEFNITFMTNTKNNNGGDTKSGKSYYDIEGAKFTLNGTEYTDPSSLVGIATMGQVITLPTVTEPAGYTFKGWYTRNGANAGLMDSSGAWGKEVQVGTTKYDLKLDSIAAGYKWEGGAGTTDTNLVNVTRDITLFARWERKKYSLTWDGNKLNGTTDPANGSTDVSVSGYSTFGTAYYGLPIGVRVRQDLHFQQLQDLVIHSRVGT